MTEEERNALAMILGAAVVAPTVAHWVSKRVRLPSVVLEIVLGIVLGPQVLGWLRIDHVIDVLATIGMLILFFGAGFEIDFKGIRGRPIGLATAGWFLSVALGFAIGWLLDLASLVSSAVIVSLAMTTTAVGTLLPMLRDAGELDTKFGRNVVAAGAIGEFAPIILIALLLQTESMVKTGGLIALFTAIAVAAAWAATKARVPAVIDFCRRMMHTSAQLPLRAAVLMLALLALVSRGLGLDTVLGAVTAGIVVSLAVRGDQREALAHKVDGLGFGFFIPIFFVVSGVRFDLAALLASPATILRVPLFLALFLVVRGLPALLLYRKDFTLGDRLRLALLCATELPLVVAITTIGVATGKMHADNAAALVGAGMLSVLLFPLVAFALRNRRPRLA